MNFAKQFGNSPATVHGGIAYSVLDEAMGSLCFHLGYPVMTKEMTIRYHKALPIDQPVYVKGWITEEDKRYFFTQGYLASSDKESAKERHVYAEAQAQFTKLPVRFFRAFFDKEALERFDKQMKINLVAGQKERGAGD
jgi:acyl-coenzyme A thioesterase PaaI-like protein